MSITCGFGRAHPGGPKHPGGISALCSATFLEDVDDEDDEETTEFGYLVYLDLTTEFNLWDVAFLPHRIGSGVSCVPVLGLNTACSLCWMPCAAQGKSASS